MDFKRIDNCRCHKPCRIFPKKTCSSHKKDVPFKETKLSVHNLYNFTITPQIPTRRENCKGVGKIPSDNCACLCISDSNANTSKVGENTSSNQPHDDFFAQKIRRNEEINEYLKKLMISPKENDTISEKEHILKFDCRKEGSQKMWLEYPPEDYSATSMKQVSEQLINTQVKDPSLFKDTNYNKTTILHCRNPRKIDIYGHALDMMNSNDLDNEEKLERNLNQDTIDRHKRNNSTKKYPFFLDARKNSQQIPSNKKHILQEAPHFECPPQSLTYSNKNCRWGGCHGPMKTKCLDDPNKGHMFMNGCQVWHCGGCCKMERDHIAYESMTLLQQFDIALGKKKLLSQLSKEQEGNTFECIHHFQMYGPWNYINGTTHEHRN